MYFFLIYFISNNYKQKFNCNKNKEIIEVLEEIMENLYIKLEWERMF